MPHDDGKPERIFKLNGLQHRLILEGGPYGPDETVHTVIAADEEAREKARAREEEELTRAMRKFFERGAKVFDQLLKEQGERDIRADLAEDGSPNDH